MQRNKLLPAAVRDLQESPKSGINWRIAVAATRKSSIRKSHWLGCFHFVKVMSRNGKEIIFQSKSTITETALEPNPQMIITSPFRKQVCPLLWLPFSTHEKGGNGLVLKKFATQKNLNEKVETIYFGGTHQCRLRNWF
jgi:hypothetical protein